MITIFDYVEKVIEIELIISPQMHTKNLRLVSIKSEKRNPFEKNHKTFFDEVNLLHKLQFLMHK